MILRDFKAGYDLGKQQGKINHLLFMDGLCNLHNAGCIMQVAGHVLWPRAAWLYHGATFLMTLSFFMGFGFKA